MKARMPAGHPCTAEAGDVLAIGRFLTPGSSAPGKEPFLVFRKADDLFIVATICYGCAVEFLAPLHTHLHGRTAWLNTGGYDVRSIRQPVEMRAIFEDTNEPMPLSRLPLDIKVRVLKKGAHYD